MKEIQKTGHRMLKLRKSKMVIEAAYRFLGLPGCRRTAAHASQVDGATPPDLGNSDPRDTFLPATFRCSDTVICRKAASAWVVVPLTRGISAPVDPPGRPGLVPRDWRDC